MPLGPVPECILEAFWCDLHLVLSYVVDNPDDMCGEGDDCEPFNSVIRSVQWDRDDCVAAIDDITDWVLWVTDAGNPEDDAVREACVRLRAGRPGGTALAS
jgi:hypothetical protein